MHGITFRDEKLCNAIRLHTSIEVQSLQLQSGDKIPAVILTRGMAYSLIVHEFSLAGISILQSRGNRELSKGVSKDSIAIAAI